MDCLGYHQRRRYLHGARDHDGGRDDWPYAMMIPTAGGCVRMEDSLCITAVHARTGRRTKTLTTALLPGAA